MPRSPSDPLGDPYCDNSIVNLEWYIWPFKKSNGPHSLKSGGHTQTQGTEQGGRSDKSPVYLGITFGDFPPHFQQKLFLDIVEIRFS